MFVLVSEDHMLDWHSCQICYPLEIKVLLLIQSNTCTVRQKMQTEWQTVKNLMLPNRA